MKRILVSTMLLPILAALMCGCATTGGGSSAANTVAVINATLPIAVAIEVQRNSNTVPYFRLASKTVRADAEAGAPPAKVTLDVMALDYGQDQYAQFTVLGGVAIWQAWLAQQSGGATNAADSKLVLTAVADAIAVGLPPATVKSLRARKLGSAQQSPRSGEPLKTIANGIASPFRAPPKGSELFGKEVTIGVGSTYTSTQQPGKRMFDDQGTWGMDFETTYWWNKYLGTGVQFGIADISEPGAGIVNGGGFSVSGRYPVGSFAPWLSVAANRDWTEDYYSTSLGGGFLYRFGAASQVRLGYRHIWREDRQPQNVVLLDLDFIVK